jgi:3-oxoacyl-[acyl-carrier protein] reductase
MSAGPLAGPLAGKVAVVTGASGPGVGSTTARLLAERGAAVVVNYRTNQEAADEVVGRITGAGGRAFACRADAGSPDQFDHLVKETVRTWGRLDILVSNAPAHRVSWLGRPGMSAFEDLTWDLFAPAFCARVRAAFVTTQAVLPVMRERGGGRLVFIGSDHADGPAAPGMIANGSGSAALVTFARYLAYELGRYGVTANVVSPGGIDSPGAARALAAAGVPPDFAVRMAATVPLGRLATPEDVARVVAFYASDDAAVMTGTVAHVNGGADIGRNARPTRGPVTG